MKISKDNDKNFNVDVLKKAMTKYAIVLPTALNDFLMDNNGGKPIKKHIETEDDSYVVRRFMSLDPDSEYYIEKPLDYFLSKTKKRIVPIGIDEGSNYYCVNIENGKVYYWTAESDKYYMISKTIDDFSKLFR